MQEENHLFTLYNGIFPDLDNEIYHGDKKSISRSSLMDFDASPYQYWANHLNPDRPKKSWTPAMQLGNAFHCMVLEPHRFNDEFVVMPEPVLLKDVGREQYDLYKESVRNVENTNKIVLGHDTHTRLVQMYSVFQKNSVAFGLIQDAKIEHSLFWRDQQSGLILKSRPDALQSNMIVDVKTTSDASPRSFQRSMVDYGYHIQGAMIRDGVEILTGNRIDKVINIVIETTYPYAMGIYIIDESAIDEGQRKYKELAYNLSSALQADVWMDYGIQSVGLPKWAM